uniref:Uncharacterized protein n=1 Tax=Anguilla anguilla TaxID=7936 RepID=A0A0E9TLW7_ANGAN
MTLILYKWRSAMLWGDTSTQSPTHMHIAIQLYITSHSFAVLYIDYY